MFRQLVRPSSVRCTKKDILQKFLNQCTRKLLSFKIDGLKYILKYTIQINITREERPANYKIINKTTLIAEERKTNLMSLGNLFHVLCTRHVSDLNISIVRSLRQFCWITTMVVLFLVRCVLEFRCGWVGMVSVLQFGAQKKTTFVRLCSCNNNVTQKRPQ